MLALLIVFPLFEDLDLKIIGAVGARGEGRPSSGCGRSGSETSPRQTSVNGRMIQLEARVPALEQTAQKSDSRLAAAAVCI